MTTKALAAVAASITLTVLIAATAGGPSTVREVCTTAGDSELCTWAVLDGQRVVEVGADVPLTLIEAVPANPEMVWPPQALASVQMPEEARAALGIDHMTVNWEAHGHPPATFMAPHFDFHFYSISQAEVAEIDCADASKPAAPPARYALPDIEAPGLGTLFGLCVPHMGMHAVPDRDVTATDAFDASMLVGYYGGQPVFFEPMVSQELLRGRADFTLAMPSVTGLPAGVRYPSWFRGEYDESTDRYRLVFGGFETQ